MSIQKPDLSSVFCSELRIHGHTTLDEDHIDKIRQLGAKKKNQKVETIIASTQYTIKKRHYTCVVVFPGLTKRKNGKVSLNFTISLQPGTFTIVPRPRQQLDSLKVLEELPKIGMKVELHLVAYFAYPTERFESVISLPYDTPVPPFEKVEVAGLRMNVKRPPHEDYSQIVDVVRGGKISHSISFKKLAHALNESFLMDLLVEASKYSKRLIKERRKNGT
jgi:hypothetical protein